MYLIEVYTQKGASTFIAVLLCRGYLVCPFSDVYRHVAMITIQLPSFELKKKEKEGLHSDRLNTNLGVCLLGEAIQIQYDRAIAIGTSGDPIFGKGMLASGMRTLVATY